MALRASSLRASSPAPRTATADRSSSPKPIMLVMRPPWMASGSAVPRGGGKGRHDNKMLWAVNYPSSLRFFLLGSFELDSLLKLYD